MPLSAIAARKARREALEAASIPAPADSPANGTGKGTGFARVSAMQEDEVDLVVALSEDEDEDEVGQEEQEEPEPARRKESGTPAGRKRANGGPAQKERKAGSSSSKNGGRYYAATGPAAPLVPDSGRASSRASRRSSVIDVDADEDANEVDGDDGLLGAAETVEGAGSPFALSPGLGAEGPITPGRPRKKRRVETSDVHSRRVSTYVPREGGNVVAVSVERLRAALERVEGKGKVKAASAEQASGEAIEDGVRQERGVIFSLGPGEDLIVSGTCTLTPLQGHLDVFSSSIAPGWSHLLFAPLTHPLPVLRGSNHPAPTRSALLEHLDLPSSMAGEDRTVFLVQAAQTGLDRMDDALLGVGRVWPAPMAGGGGGGAFGIRGFYPILEEHDRPVYPHETPASWRAALDGLPSLNDTSDQPDAESSASHPYIALVRGPKRSGKSTFAREATNALLNSYERVAYLDCDLGQSEFGCGGAVELQVVSRPLLGPNFTHPGQAVKSVFLGSLSPTLCAEAYLAAIAALLEHYRFEVQYPVTQRTRGYNETSNHNRISEIVPLVVNTQGWVKGLGADLLLELEGMVQPTVVFDFVADVVGGTDEGEWGEIAPTPQSTALPDSSDDTKRIVTLSTIPATPLLSKYTAAEFRILSMMSYLHSVAPSPASTDVSAISQQWDYSSPLVRQRPWRVDLSVIREIYLAGEGADAVVQDDLPLALNGAVVALAERTAPQADTPADAAYVTGRPLPPPEEVHCLGLAVIHSIAPDLSAANIITPISPRDLARASIVIKGELELPVMAMLDWTSGPVDEDQGLLGTAWEDVPFLQVGAADGVGMGRRRYRRNVMRKGQMA